MNTFCARVFKQLRTRPGVLRGRFQARPLLPCSALLAAPLSTPPQAHGPRFCLACSGARNRPATAAFAGSLLAALLQLFGKFVVIAYPIGGGERAAHLAKNLRHVLQRLQPGLKS